MCMPRAAHLTAPGFALAIVTAFVAPASAQEPTDAPSGRVTVSGGVEFLNAYSFRGIRQDDTGVIMWPHVNLGLSVYESTGGLKTIRLSGGTWNSLHTGAAGSDGPSGKRWYQSDAHAALELTFARGVTVGTAYRAYTSPNDMFTTVKEVSLTLGVDDRGALGRAALRPYVLAAFELDASPGTGQVDGGFDAGRYLELGAAPRFAARALDVAVPVKVGLSLGGYYELAGTDRTFGFASVAGIVTVPLGPRTGAGAWNVHGGVEYQLLGDTARVFNNDERTKVIASIGVGWSR